MGMLGVLTSCRVFASTMIHASSMSSEESLVTWIPNSSQVVAMCVIT